MSTMLKRLLSLAVALVMVIGLMPWNAASVYATEETTADTTWYDAEQAEFTIDTAAELMGLAQLASENNFAGKTIILGDDISLAGIAWTPIGTSTVPFAGTFDGNDKTISDMSLTTTGNGGFFAYLCGEVKDLTVSGSINSTGGVTGGIAANIKSGASLSNVASNVNITHSAGSNNGGIVGLILDQGTYTIEDCSYNGTFTGTKSDNIGGILGNANGKGSTINITNCTVAGSISAKAQVGGFIGNTHNTNTIVISGSTNEAAITGTGNSVGGLVGTNGASSLTIENSSNSGAITGKAVGAGGILGGFNATGSVAISGTTNTGAWYNANATTFTISTVDELLQFNELAKSYDFKGKTVNVSTDLDLTNVAWAPIGLHVNAKGTAVGKAFAGTFNGNGHTISGMKAEPSGSAGSWGFFGQIAGTLKNFTVSGSMVGTGNQMGGVTGALRSGAKLENVTSNVDMTITGSNVGGFAGRVEQAGTYVISGCTYGGTLSATGNAVGGILGNANNKVATFTISNCTIAEGAEISGTNQVGGIVGNAHNGNTFTISGTNNADISGNQSVGGIVGLLGDSVMSVSDSVNNGDILAADGHVAGIVGQMNGGSDLTVTGCTNNGVIISGGSEFGGIVGTGRRTLTIENSRNNGAVTATQENDSEHYGAIVGSLYGDSEEKPCVVTFGGEEGVTYLPICSDQAYSLKVTEEGEAGSFVTVNGECTVYDPNPLGSENNPIIITEATELTSISVEAGKTIYYAINGQLNDYILTIASNENVTITLNGAEFSESAVLTGTPVNVLVIANNSEEAITLTAEISHPGCTEHSYDDGVETKAPTCSEDGEMTYTCTACGETYTEAIDATGEHSYMYECDAHCQVCGELTNPDAAHAVEHAEAVEGDCQTMGNIEHWYCTICGSAWLDAELTQQTNLMSVKTGYGDHSYMYECDATCQVCGELTNPDAAHTVEHVAESCYNIEYWYCTICASAWTDEAMTQVTNIKNVNKAEASHNLEHVAESCYNTEYWFCDICETYWADEALTQITNSHNVIKAVPSHNIIHVEAKAGDCQTIGNIEHWYCDICDTVWADEALTQITNHMSVKTGYGDHLNLEYQDNYDFGVSHKVTCADCGTVIAEEEPHNWIDGECVCGNYEPGSMYNPLPLYPMDFVDGKYTANVAAGKTVYYCVNQASGADIYVDDVYAVTCNFFGGNFAITNDGTEAADYVVSLVWPTGHANNPDTLVIGENGNAANGDYYYYAWTATEDGELTITMNCDNWAYLINNLTTGTYGDTHWNDDDPVVASSTVAVSAGDEIIVAVSDYWSGADVAFTADFAPAVELFDFVGSNVNLGNSLAMNFALLKSNVSDWTGHYAEITRETETGEIKTTTIPVSGWTSSGSYYLIPYEGLAAKEMSDKITVTIYNAEGQAVSVTREESIAIYAVRTLELEQAKAAPNKELMTALVDMLYYGEAAQVYFKYNTDDLPTDLLDDVQKAMATGDVTATDSRVKDANCLGTNLNLESKILMTAVFSGVTEGMTAKYSFINHDNKQIESDASITMKGGYAYVEVDALAVADVSKMVTITVYNADGTPYSSVSESMESYIARSTGDLAVLCEAIMKFGTGAYNYFH